jgi:hypothetical protein
MYYTHHFGNHAALTRARNWLSHLGFGPDQVEVHTDGVPRISMQVEPLGLSGVELLFQAVERSDPRGCPGLWDVARQPHFYPSPRDEARLAPHLATRTRSTAIGWHPAD